MCEKFFCAFYFCDGPSARRPQCGQNRAKLGMYMPHAEQSLPQMALGWERRESRTIAMMRTAVTAITTTTQGNGSSDMQPHSHLVRYHRTQTLPRPLYVAGKFIPSAQPSNHQDRVAMATAASRALVAAWATIASLMRPVRRVIRAKTTPAINAPGQSPP